MLTEEEWRLMAEAVVALVFDEYPDGVSLVDIVESWSRESWGRATPQQLDAIRKYEASL